MTFEIMHLWTPDKIILKTEFKHIVYAKKINTKKTNRIYHRSPMQIEKSQPAVERTMPETRFTEFPAFSVDPRVGIDRSASETDD